jgi:hypothetical protein
MCFYCLSCTDGSKHDDEDDKQGLALGDPDLGRKGAEGALKGRLMYYMLFYCYMIICVFHYIVLCHNVILSYMRFLFPHTRAPSIIVKRAAGPSLSSRALEPGASPARPSPTAPPGPAGPRSQTQQPDRMPPPSNA